MLMRVRLYGHLAGAFGPEEMTLDVDTVAQVFSALRYQLDGFKEYLMTHSDPGYFVVVDGKPMRCEDLELMVSAPGTVRIVPAVRGAGDGKNIGMTIAGVLLAVVGAVFGQGWAVAIGFSLALGGIGGLLTQGGTAAMLSPMPQTETEEKRKRKYFSRLSETVEQGAPIPIRYGRQVVEGYPISVKQTIVNSTV